MTEEATPGESAAAVGLLCGGGALPLRVAGALLRGGRRVVAVGITGEADPALADVVEGVRWTGLAKLGQWVSIFKSAGVEAVLMVGAIHKQRMFGNVAAMLPDWRSVKVWYEQLNSKEDHTILGAVVGEFEKEGLRVGSVADYCPELLLVPGLLTRRRPDERHWRDIRFGWPIAKQIAALQVGQCIVVKDQAVIAVEGIDGTDAALERGGRLAGGRAVAVKVAREGHDERFDIPCVGPDTVDTLRGAAIAVLALEAERTIMLDRDEVKREADAAGLCIIALTTDQVNASP